MSKPVTPGWPEIGAFPFMSFAGSGANASQPPAMPGLTGGIDQIKEFWSRLPGGAALTGFMAPTIDVEELDKRIGDLKAAEQWVEVNLNMLRATIQGLEVQRHTIAAIQALTTPASNTGAPPAAAEPASPAAAPPANEWLDYLQAQFAKVAQAVVTPAAFAPSAKSAPQRRKPAKKVATKSSRVRKAPSPR